MINIIGLIGLILLATSFIFLALKKEKIFLIIDLVATILLFIYSIISKDIIFICVNTIIVASLGYRVFLLLKN